MLSIGPAIIQRSEIEERHIRSGFTFAVLFSTFMTLLIIAAAPVFAAFFHMPELTTILRVIALMFPFTGLSVVADALLQKELQFRRLTTVGIVSYSIGYIIIGVSLAFMGFGVWALVVAHLANTIIHSITLLVIQTHPKKLQFDISALKDLFYFGGGWSIAKVFNYFAIQGDNLIVGRYLGAEALGFYGRAYNLMNFSNAIIGKAFDKTLFPAMAKVQHQKRRLSEAYRRSFTFIAFVTIPLSTSIFILAPEIINVLLGPNWTEVIIPFQILTIGMLFRASYKVSASLLRATGKIYQFAWRQFIFGFMVLFCVFWGKKWGLSGVATGVIIAVFINFLLLTQFALKMTIVNIKEFLNAHFQAFLIAIIIGGQLWYVVNYLREVFQFPIAILSIAAILVACNFLLLYLLTPKWLLGKDGVWLLNKLNLILRPGSIKN